MALVDFILTEQTQASLVDGETNDDDDAHCTPSGPVLPDVSVEETMVVELVTPSGVDLFDLGNRVTAFEHLKERWIAKKGMVASLYKLTKLPRNAGARVWFSVDNNCEHEQSKEVLAFLLEYVGKLTGGNKSKVILLTKKQVAVLRWQDEQYKTQIQFVEEQVEKEGLRVAGNLSSLLMKGKNLEKIGTQRKVSHLCDLVSNVNTLVKRRRKPVKRKHVDDEEDDEDDEEPS